MKIAFYYHVVISSTNGILKVPGYLGVFIDSMAAEVDMLYLLMHEAKQQELDSCDYVLKSTNIIWINLGIKTPAWHRAIYYQKILKKALAKVEVCDVIIVRSPTPLAPYFHKYLVKPVLWFMIVGDYVEGAINKGKLSFRDKMIYYYLHYNDWLFTKRIQKTAILVNSPGLFDKYLPIAKNIYQIKTTTLTNADFFYRDDTCRNEVIELLYTGRIDPAKGLFELVNAVKELIVRGYNIRFNIVGWEDGKNQPVEKALLNKAFELGIEENFIFHGRKTVGEELNHFYRMADIYVIPSYHEGFPRTIWEAMANSLPVVATNVGGIPAYLQDGENALLIQPFSVDSIVKAVVSLIEEKNIRQKIISAGLKLAKENTLEIQSKNIVSIIAKHQ